MQATLSTTALLKKVWSIASPMAASRLVNVIASFMGILFVARLGHAELAASALITATSLPLFLIASSPLFAISVIVGHAYGAKQHESIGGILQQSWLLSLIISAFVIAIPLLIKPIFLALGQEAELTHIVQSYFFVYAFAIPGLLCSVATSQVLVAIGKQRTVLWVNMINAVIFIILAPILIYGKGLIPPLGVPGLALDWVLLSWINLIIYLLVFLKTKNWEIYKIFTWQIPHTFHFMKKIISIGWPITLQMASDLLCLFAITIIVGWLGENALAAQQIVTQYYILLVVPILALSQAGGVLISQARGAEDYHLIKRYANGTLLMGISFATLVTFIFIFFPHTLVKVYLHTHLETAETQELASIVLILTGFRLIFDTIMEIKIGNLRGLFDTRWPMMIMLISTWFLYIPIAYMLAFMFHFGLIGIQVANILMTLIGAVIVWLRWLKRSRKFVSYAIKT